MTDDNNQTKPSPQEFDYSSYPQNSLFHERRNRRDRANTTSTPSADKQPLNGDGISERRQKKERRRRIDPTTFEKQYTDDEMEFMNAMQRFKELSGKTFPTYGEVSKWPWPDSVTSKADFEFDPLCRDDLEGRPSVIIANPALPYMNQLAHPLHSANSAPSRKPSRAFRRT